MKRIKFVLLTILLGGGLCAFNYSGKKNEKDSPYCVEIECKKDPNCQNGCVWHRYKEVIYAFNASAAIQTAKDKHPGCRVLRCEEGNCNK